jgi:hypothetical protein
MAASGELNRVSATTVSGELALDVTTGPSSIDASSVSGDVTVRLPEGEGVHVTASAVSGRLVVDGVDHSRGRLPGHKLDVTTGDGRSRLSAGTVSGHVTVLRAARRYPLGRDDAAPTQQAASGESGGPSKPAEPDYEAPTQQAASGWPGTPAGPDDTAPTQQPPSGGPGTPVGYGTRGTV